MKLLVTLGHNSSAILTKGTEVLIGYEEERLSKIKSDSAFPKLAIAKILEYFPAARRLVTEIKVSHWFWDFELVQNKYYDKSFLEVNFPKAKVHSLKANATHHDAHANSVWNFCDGNTTGLTIVADGFGNKGECLSLYHEGLLTHRSYAIKWSLGLMYQYAVAYLGMKEHQDEYKLLGYEQQCDSQQKTAMIGIITTTNMLQLDGLMDKTNPEYTSADLSQVLSDVRAHWYAIFQQVDHGLKDKAVIGYFVQSLLEKAMLHIVGSCPFIKVSGGVFYNVKLNNAIIRQHSVKHFEANPLCGDQGCALGMADIRYEHVFWGKRRVHTIEPHDGYIQVHVGNMEFGPRALGNTSTIMEPTMEMVEKINALNGRDTVMPMAPIVTEAFAKTNFRDFEKLGKCKYFMIASLDYYTLKAEWRGAAHIDTNRHQYTARPQVINEWTNEYVANAVSDIMINTSLNAHGQPIIYDENDFEIMENIQRTP